MLVVDDDEDGNEFFHHCWDETVLNFVHHCLPFRDDKDDKTQPSIESCVFTHNIKKSHETKYIKKEIIVFQGNTIIG